MYKINFHPNKKMKKGLTVLLSLSFALFTFTASLVLAAQKNPLIRDCQQSQGVFIATDSNNALCALNTNLVGALDVVHFKNKIKMPLSLKAYIAGKTICQGQTRLETWGNGSMQVAARVCVFSDDSMIDLDTLSKGFNSASNAALNQFLQNYK